MSTVAEFAGHEPSLVAKEKRRLSTALLFLPIYESWSLFRLLFGFSVVLTLVGLVDLIDIFVLDYFLSIFDLFGVFSFNFGFAGF